MKKYLIAINVFIKHGSIITAVCLDFEEISITNISLLREKCLNHYEISILNPSDVTILGWSEFAS